MEKNKIVLRSKVTGKLYDDAEVIHVWDVNKATSTCQTEQKL